MTYEEILAVLEEKFDSQVDNFAYEDYNQEELGLGEVKEVAQQGGEGEGDTWYSVKYFKDHDVYVRVDGHYTSHNGTDFYGSFKDCCSNVKPQERLVTFYE